MISPTSSGAPSTEDSSDVLTVAPSRQVEPDTRPRRVLYGRKSGPGLGPKQRERLARLLPEREITLPERGQLAPGSLFTPPRARVWLEIGFGGGEHLAWQAAANPAVGLIGVEPYLDGVVRLLTMLDVAGASNVVVYTDDARLLIDRLQPGSLERIFVLFADPWPKKRHWKRRIINPATTARFADLLVEGGELRVATDDPGYRRWILATLLAEPRLEWQAEGPNDWRQRPPDWPPTRYEGKAIAAGRRPVFLQFRRCLPT